MAKKGFLSWLGFGRQEAAAPAATPSEEPIVEQKVEPQADLPVETGVSPDVDAEAPVAATIPDEGGAAETERVVMSDEAVTGEMVEAVEDAPTAVVVPVSDATAADTAPVVELPAAVDVLPAAEPLVVPAAEITVAVPEPAVVAAPVADPAEDQAVSGVEAPREKPARAGLFGRLVKGLMRTRESIGAGFIALFRGKKLDDDLFDELETQLLTADLGVETTRRIIDNLTKQASLRQLKDAEALYDLLRQEMAAILQPVSQPLALPDNSGPFVILMVGVNGVGKTTTIGKLAKRFQAEGKSVMLAAGDTFRAAAVEQLQVWGERNHIPVIAQHTGADSASVIFDALQAAKARGVDVLIADTAGRLQNKNHLMEELKKIVRVMQKLDPSAPHEVMLTLDAGTGQNALSQAKLFGEAVGITGIALTKLDGTAKGGVIFAIADRFGIPIRYIGVGEGIDDLRPFRADDFIEALFSKDLQ